MRAATTKLSLDKPFGNKELQKDIQEKGYHCILHVWGTADRTKDYVWRDHGTVIGSFLYKLSWLSLSAHFICSSMSLYDYSSFSSVTNSLVYIILNRNRIHRTSLKASRRENLYNIEAYVLCLSNTNFHHHSLAYIRRSIGAQRKNKKKKN